jgi:hypothetical protein
MVGVLIQDEYCGEMSPEGGMYRPHLHQLSPAQTRSAIAAWDGDWQQWYHDNCEHLCDGKRYWGTAEAALKRALRRAAKTTA